VGRPGAAAVQRRLGGRPADAARSTGVTATIDAGATPPNAAFAVIANMPVNGALRRGKYL